MFHCFLNKFSEKSRHILIFMWDIYPPPENLAIDINQTTIKGNLNMGQFGEVVWANN